MTSGPDSRAAVHAGPGPLEQGGRCALHRGTDRRCARPSGACRSTRLRRRGGRRARPRPRHRRPSAVSPDGRRWPSPALQTTSRRLGVPVRRRPRRPARRRPAAGRRGLVGVGPCGRRRRVGRVYAEQQAGRSTARGVRVDLGTGAATVLAEDVAKPHPCRPAAVAVAYGVSRPVAGSRVGQSRVGARSSGMRHGRERLLSSWGQSGLYPRGLAPRRTGRPVHAVRRPWQPAFDRRMADRRSLPAAAPSRVLLATGDKQFWQGRYSPDGRWVSFVAFDAGREASLELGITPADGRSGSTWTRIAAEHAWPDKPRWSPDGTHALLPVSRLRGLLQRVGRAHRSRAGRCAGRAIPGHAFRFAAAARRSRHRKHRDRHRQGRAGAADADRQGQHLAHVERWYLDHEGGDRRVLTDISPRRH